MKRVFLLLPGAVFTVLALSGCGPELAKTHLGEKEIEWKQYLEESYPEWRPPQTLPPIVTEKKQAVAPKSTNPELGIEEETVVIMPEENAQPQISDFETYTVAKGDSLWKIALKFYKDGNKWRRIKDANPELLKNADKIKPGTRLRIPLP
jgi:nucleoid-associated protein YgaU